MSDFYLGEIRLFSFGYAPDDWAQCNGQAMQVQQNAALSSLLGTQFGGDGRTTFNLPDLRGRAIIGRYTGLSNPPNVSTSYNQGAAGGVEGVSLTAAMVPSHTHNVLAVNSAADSAFPSNAFYADAATTTANNFVTYPAAPPQPALAALDPSAVSTVGGASAHNNMQPFLTLNYCIAVSGVYPSRN